jgi:hypothetical protein
MLFCQWLWWWFRRIWVQFITQVCIIIMKSGCWGGCVGCYRGSWTRLSKRRCLTSWTLERQYAITTRGASMSLVRTVAYRMDPKRWASRRTDISINLQSTPASALYYCPQKFATQVTVCVSTPPLFISFCTATLYIHVHDSRGPWKYLTAID